MREDSGLRVSACSSHHSLFGVCLLRMHLSFQRRVTKAVLRKPAAPKGPPLQKDIAGSESEISFKLDQPW